MEGFSFFVFLFGIPLLLFSPCAMGINRHGRGNETTVAFSFGAWGGSRTRMKPGFEGF